MSDIPPPRRGVGGAVGYAVGLGIAAILGLSAVQPLVTGNPPAVTAEPLVQSTVPSGRRPGVANIDTVLGFRNARAAGTGIVLDATGTVLTNNHVIQGATRIKVTDTDNGRSYSARVLGYSRTADIAVLRLRNATKLKPARLGDSSKVGQGDVVTAVGNAGGRGGPPTVVTGTVMGMNESIIATDQSDGSTERLSGLIRTSAPIQPGDSGGPLLDTAGRVIGIDTAASYGYHMKLGTGEGYSIPINRAMPVIRQILKGTASPDVHIGRTALLGVQVQASTATGRGAAVTRVFPRTPAASAGLLPGAVIDSVDGESVDSPGKLTGLLLRHHPDDTVRIGWMDALGRHHMANVRLAEGPAQ
ncbi:S1C family serine protease [Actinomadura scrupuli]|uniref:S1C family serine protease n=1 Tax=Actinomadura scrupuli TaxID=559629 RepID=UPI003D97F9F5